MRTAFAVGVGFALGLVVGFRLLRPDEKGCCRRVAAAVKDKVRDKLGDTAAEIGELFGVYNAAPGLLDTLGVDP